MTTNRLFRRLVSCALVAGLGTASTIHSLPVHAAAPASPLIIGEVAWAGSSLSTADEWLELWNVSDEPIALAGWTLAGASDAPLVLPDDATIAPHDLFLISNNAEGDDKSVLATTTHLVTTAVSLSNSKLLIELINPDGDVIDTAGNGSIPLAGTSTPVKASMIRQGESWVTATTTMGMRDDVTDLGTPGVCDQCGNTTPSPAETPPDEATSTSTETMLQIDSPPTTTDAVTSTSAEAILALDVATSTEDAIDLADATTTFDEAATSTTETSQNANASSTTELSEALTANTTQTNDPPPPPAVPPKPVYAMLRINEIFPAPSSGKEWVELTTLDAGNSIDLKGCMLFDGQGRLLTFASKTIDPAISRYLVVQLSSARLNNNGDSVTLYGPDGQLIDTFTYKATEKDQAWIRFPDQSGDWELSQTATPGFANVRNLIPVAPPLASTTPSLTISEATPITATILEEATELAATSTADNVVTKKPISTTQTKAPAKQSTTASTQKPTSAPKTKTQPTTTQTTTQTKTASKTAVKPADIIHPYTFDMFSNTDSDIRVHLTGRVGSPLGLLSSHAFILQNDDGRGIQVSVPTKLHLPLFGNEVAISGTLHIDDLGIASIKMNTKDQWTAIPAAAKTVPPRIVDLLFPGAEDAWSLINVTGTVTSVSGSTVHLDLDGADADAIIRPVLKYRAKRLAVGDVVAMTGILDLGKDTPRILPRSADEITIISHAPAPTTSAIAVPQSQGPTLPGWTPLGAAAGAIGVTEGTKRLHKKFKLRKLEKKLAQI